MNKQAYRLNMTVLGLVVLVGIWFLYLLIFPWNIVRFDAPKIELGKTVVKAGDVLPLKYPFIKYVDIFPTIHRRLVNEVTYQLPTYSGSIGPGRMDRWVYSMQIPKHLPEGRYKLIIDFDFKINFLRDYRVTITSDEFMVIK